MSQVQAKLDIRTVLEQIVTDHTAYPIVVEIDNRTLVNQATQVKPYLKAEIKFMGSDQLDLGNASQNVEQWGQIWLTVVSKGGQGTADATALIDFITPYFDLRRFSLVQCRSVTSVGGKEMKGLWHQPLIVNFYYHRRT